MACKNGVEAAGTPTTHKPEGGVETITPDVSLHFAQAVEDKPDCSLQIAQEAAQLPPTDQVAVVRAYNKEDLSLQAAATERNEISPLVPAHVTQWNRYWQKCGLTLQEVLGGLSQPQPNANCLKRLSVGTTSNSKRELVLGRPP